MRDVQQEPQGQVGVFGGLVLIEGQPGVDHKGQVILDGHVDRILQSIDLQKLRILIVGSSHCIIQLQQPLLVKICRRYPAWKEAFYSGNLSALCNGNKSIEISFEFCRTSDAADAVKEKTARNIMLYIYTSTYS